MRRLEDRINAAERLLEARLDARFARLEDRINAAERLSEARLDARLSRLEAPLERTLQAQTDVLRDLTAKLETLGACQADGDAAARSLATNFETIRAERREDYRTARKRHIQVIATVVGAALATAAAVIGLGPFSIGAFQIGATLPALLSEEPAVSSRERTVAQPLAQAAPPAPVWDPPVRPPDQPEQAAVQAPVPLPPAPRTVERAVSRVDLAAVSAAVTAAVDCGLIASMPTADSVSIAGVVRRGEEEAVRGTLNAFGVESAASRISLQAFDGPYCDALTAMRLDAAAPGDAPHLSLVSTEPFGTDLLVAVA